jgi:RNA polymerase sigma factor (sigma-70 family)
MQAGLRQFRECLHRQCGRVESDEELLTAFLARREEAAFAALVRRHGPMVLAVCRRVLGHPQDAEDTFQAVFLILACSAASLRDRTALASWLHGVAYRTAMQAKRAAARRRKYESQKRSPAAADPPQELLWREVRIILDEEINRLPEAYRGVFVLCCLECLSHKEAGRRLGLKERTVCSRLASARQRLSQRLARRGVELSALLAATALTTEAHSALPAELVRQTAQAATSGQSLFSPALAALVKAGPPLLAGKGKVASLVLLAAGLLAGIGLWAGAGHVLQPVTPPAARASDRQQPAQPQPEDAKTVTIQGRVLGTDGRPKVGAKLLLLSQKEKITSLGMSAADGRFTAAVPRKTTESWGHYLVAQSDGAGLDFLDLYQLKVQRPVELRLVKDHAVRGRVVNTEGKPIRGVHVVAERIEVYLQGSLDTFLAAYVKMLAGGAGTGQEKQLWSQGAGVLFAATTNADGRFTLHGLGAERTVVLRLSGAGIATTSLWVANRAGFDPQPINQAHLETISKNHRNWRWSVLHGPAVSVVAQPEKVIHGTVKDADTGKGQPGILVRLTEDSDELVQHPPEARTDARGRYEIHGVRKTKKYLVSVDCNPDTGTMASQVWATDTAGYQPVPADIQIKKGVIVTGKLLDATSAKPVRGEVMAAVLRGNPFVKDYPHFSDRGFLPFDSFCHTDADGVYRVVTIPGPMLLMAKTEGKTRVQYKSTGPDAKYPQYFDNGGFLGHDFMAPLQGLVNKVVEIKPGAAVVKQDIVLHRANVLADVRVTDAEGRALAGVWAASGPDSWTPYGPLEEPACTVHGEAARKPQLLVLYQPDRKLASSVTIKGDRKQTLVVKLGPAGTIKGRLLDAAGKALAGIVVDLHYVDAPADSVHKEGHYGKQIVSDSSGHFIFDAVIPDLKFELTFRRGVRKLEPTAQPAGGAYQVKPGAALDAGTVKLRQAAGKERE